MPVKVSFKIKVDFLKPLKTGESIFKMQLISPAEINYRKKIEEKLIEDEFLFRITVAKIRQISQVGIELCNIEDEDEESAKGMC